MKRLLLVSHRPLDQAGGPTARWRSLSALLPRHGWEVDVLAASEGLGAAEFSPSTRARRLAALRASAMARVASAGGPLFARAGIRPDAVPLSVAWVPRGAVAVRRRLRDRRFDAVLATGPPIAAPFAARLGARGSDVPLVIELRDLWAGSPAFDAGGSVLGRLEDRLFAGARMVVGCTPEAVHDLRARHAGVRVEEVTNGFAPELLDMPRRENPAEPLTIIHSGTLTADRPLAPLLGVLAGEPFRSAFRLVLHGYLAPAIRAEVAAGAAEVEVLPPSGWGDAVRRVAGSDVALVSQAAGAGDATAVAAKVYEYLALGRPVLCLSDGGATEALLRRVGAERFCARLSDPASIEAALRRLLEDPRPPSIDRAALAPYDRRALAERMAALLDEVSG